MKDFTRYADNKGSYLIGNNVDLIDIKGITLFQKIYDNQIKANLIKANVTLFLAQMKRLI